MVLAGAAALSGCTWEPAKQDKGLTCFPADARPWIYLTHEEQAKPEGPPAAAHATIYVDHSASMAGYVVGDTPFDRPFHDLVHTLPDAVRDIGGTAEYRAFGTTISDPIADVRTFDKAGYFSCVAKTDPGCESHIDQVLTRVADHQDEMAVMLSDLWFDNSTTQTSGLTDLRPPLAKILSGGRTVAIYGISAPFDGKIYDLPTGDPATRTLAHHGRHPLFMLVVGSKAQVLEFDRQLERGRAGSAAISRALRDGSIHRSIFTVSPGPDHPRQRKPMDKGSDPLIRNDDFDTFGKASIQQFRLGGGALFSRGTKPPAPAWIGPHDDAFIDHAVWQGDMAPRTRIWQQRDTKCTAASWISLGTMEGGWDDADGGKRRFALDPAKFYARVRRNGTYLVTGELVRQSVASPNQSNAWMDAWTLEPAHAASVAARRPDFFPTLNLGEVARIMEGSLATAAERKGGGVTGFSVLVKVDR